MKAQPSRLRYPCALALTASAAVCGPLLSLGDGTQANTVLLSEIKPFREHPADFVWVEVCNFGDDAVDIAGWRLQDGSGEIHDVPQTIAPLPPDGCFVAVFPSGPVPETLTGIPCVVVADEEVAVRFLSASHECALFRRDAEGGLCMVDYVAWELRGTPRTLLADAASAAGLDRDYVGTYRKLQDPGDGPRLPVEGTIGRRSWSLPHQPWHVYRSADSTPGLRNVPGQPDLLGPDGGVFVMNPGSHMAFQWQGEPVATLQVSRDPTFADPVVEVRLDLNEKRAGNNKVAFTGEDVWPEGTYCWRLKNHWLDPRDGTPRETSWSDTGDFGVQYDPPPETAPWPPGEPLPDLPLGDEP